jgi:hypothetical protein
MRLARRRAVSKAVLMDRSGEKQPLRALSKKCLSSCFQCRLRRGGFLDTSRWPEPFDIPSEADLIALAFVNEIEPPGVKINSASLSCHDSVLSVTLSVHTHTLSRGTLWNPSLDFAAPRSFQAADFGKGLIFRCLSYPSSAACHRSTSCCRPNQNSGVVSKSRASRWAISADTLRFSLTISLIVNLDTPMSVASLAWVSPVAGMISLRSSSPGCVGGNFFCSVTETPSVNDSPRDLHRRRECLEI